MIYGTDQFFLDEDGVRWQKCLCTARQPGVSFTRLVTVFADEGNNYVVDSYSDFDYQLTGQNKELMVLFYPRGSVIVFDERPA